MQKKVKSNGIFYGWVVVFASTMLTASYGVFYTMTIFFNSLKAEFGWSSTLISSIQSVHLFLYLFLGLFISRLTERFEPRIIFGICAVLAGAGFAMLSQVNTIGQFYLFYLISTVGIAGMWAPPLAFTQRWFIQKKGFALGIVAAGIGIGALIHAPLANYLISSLGWRQAYLIEGLITFFVIAAGALLFVSDPAKKGLRPLGAEEIEVSAAQKVTDHDWTLKEAIKTRALLATSLAYLFTVLPIQMLGVHFVPFVTGVGINRTAAVTAWSILNGASILGRVWFGDVGQKLGWKKTFISSCLICAAATVLLITINKALFLYAFAVVFGLFYGGRTTQVFGLIGYCFGNSRSLPTLTSFAHSVSILGGISGPLIGGFIYDQSGSYWLAFVISAISWLLAALVIVLVQKPVKQFKTPVMKALNLR